MTLQEDLDHDLRELQKLKRQIVNRTDEFMRELTPEFCRNHPEFLKLLVTGYEYQRDMVEVMEKYLEAKRGTSLNNSIETIADEM